MTRNRPGMKPVRTEDNRPDGGDAAATEYAPRKMSLGENVILTIKVLVGFGLLGMALWGINLWTAPK